MVNNFGEKVSFIWSVADLLRGPYKPAQYGKVILPRVHDTLGGLGVGGSGVPVAVPPAIL